MLRLARAASRGHIAVRRQDDGAILPVVHLDPGDAGVDLHVGPETGYPGGRNVAVDLLEVHKNNNKHDRKKLGPLHTRDDIYSV